MKKMSGRIYAQTSIMEWIVSSVPNFSQSPVPQNVIVFKGKVFKEVIKLEWDLQGGP